MPDARLNAFFEEEQLRERATQLLANEASAEFVQIQERRPDLRPFMTLSNLVRAIQAFKNIRKILKNTPDC